MFHGSLVALVTPMRPDGSIDYDALTALIEWHIENETDGLVILGTTGESATVNAKERKDIINHAVNVVKARVPVIAGTGANSTAVSIEFTREAADLGVDACLLVTPYYNKPTQEGLFQHYSEIAKAVAIPQLLYNVPSRTACDLLPETAIRLSEIANIVGLKDATADLTRVKAITSVCGDALALYSGDDVTGCDFILEGGKGVISVTANVAPKLMHEMCVNALEGNATRAHELNEQLMPLHINLFVESNPIPAKWALNKMGMIEEGIRLPLTPLSAVHHDTVQNAMREVGI